MLLHFDGVTKDQKVLAIDNNWCLARYLKSGLNKSERKYLQEKSVTECLQTQLDFLNELGEYFVQGIHFQILNQRKPGVFDSSLGWAEQSLLSFILPSYSWCIKKNTMWETSFLNHGIMNRWNFDGFMELHISNTDETKEFKENYKVTLNN